MVSLLRGCQLVAHMGSLGALIMMMPRIVGPLDLCCEHPTPTYYTDI